ncbi:hypothetical protein C5S53_06715 [Methanophagales archaeon]|nr:hypothetical protein C5S53_06715 [Methanophagales archaeon]
MNVKRSTFVIVAALALLASMVGMASAAASQTWYFTNAPSEAGLHYEMHKGSGSGTADVSVLSNKHRYWNAQAVAVDSIDMHGQWHVNIDYRVPGHASDDSTIEVEIGLWSDHFESKGTHEATATGGSVNRNLNANININSFDMSSGDYLLLRVNNKNSYNIAVNTTSVSGNSPSYLSSPSTDPGYPVPELSTLLLTGMGALMLGGFVIYSRRRNNK